MSKRPSASFNDPGYFYSQKRLLKIFTFAALALVVGIVWLIVDDWDRAWKDEQRAAQRWLARKLSVEEFILETRTQDLRARLDRDRTSALEAIEKRQEELAEIDRKLQAARGEFQLADMAFKNKKQFTLRDEFLVSHSAETEADVREYYQTYFVTFDEEKRLQQATKLAASEVDRLVKQRKALRSDLTELLDQERKNPELKKMQLLAAAIERNRDYNKLRNVPLLDFLAPPTKVEQIVLAGLVDNYEFSLPNKVDRCGTCHVNSMKIGFEWNQWPQLEGLEGTARSNAFEEGVYRFAYSLIESVWPTKVARSDPHFYEKDVLRTLAIHHEVLDLMFADYDPEEGEIGVDKQGRKIWRQWKRDGDQWVAVEEGGASLAQYYRDVHRRMRKQWRTHPHLDDMVGDQSPHPYESVGCSVCHQGRGWSVDFGLSFHMPDRQRVDDFLGPDWEPGGHAHANEPKSAIYTLAEAMRIGLESAADPEATALKAAVGTAFPIDAAKGHEWEDERGWTETKRHYWMWPQLPKSLVQASCLKCHKEGYLSAAQPEYENVRFGKPDPEAPDIEERLYHYKEFNDNQEAAEAGEYNSRLFVPKETEPYRPETLDAGLDHFVRFGCYGCHKVDPKVYPLMETVRPKVAPPLDHASRKFADEEILRKWLRKPRDLRPNTRMPQFWDLSNNSHSFSYLFVDGLQEVNGAAWSESEIYAISRYLWSESEKRNSGVDEEAVPAGDPERGRKIVIGDWKSSDAQAKACIACHDIRVEGDLAYARPELAAGSVDKQKTGWNRRMSRRQGPALEAIGSKVRPAWLFAWLKSPRDYWHDSNMPNLRLTDQEAADIVAYLMTLTRPEFDALPGVPKHAGILLKMAQELKAAEGAGRTDAAIAAVKRMSEDDRIHFVGKTLVKHYGCFGCHTIEDYKNATPIGTELTEWGSKLIARLEFNDVPIEQTHFDFAYTKLLNPRIYDWGRPRRDRPYDRLKMPRFGFTAAEANEIATFLVGLVNDPIPPESLFQPDERQRDIIRGRQIVKRYNCQGCHVIEGDGGDIWPSIQDAKWRPPDLLGQGAKTDPGWLFRYLKNPDFVAVPGETDSDRVRPWHSIRMPTFGLTDEEARALVRYFAALSRETPDFQSVPPDSLVGPGAAYPRARSLTVKDPKDETKRVTIQVRNRLEEARALFTEYGCKACHVSGGDVANQAPNFRHTRDGRLRNEWLATWLWGPSKLQPGTAMPTFFVNTVGGRKQAQAQDPSFFGGDPEEQIRALRDFIRYHYREQD